MTWRTSSQENTHLWLECKCPLFSALLVSLLVSRVAPARGQLHTFLAACGLAVPCHPQTLGQVARSVQREMFSPNFPPSSKGGSYIHRA